MENEVSAQANMSAANVKPQNGGQSQKFVELDRINVIFPTRKGPFHALQDISLSVAQGEFVTLIGHSGCGKSTLLNVVAGLNLPSSGAALCAGREIPGPGPDRGVVFQNHSLLPWLTCFENVHLAVETVFGRKEGKAKLKTRAEDALKLVNLGHAMHKRPQEISGGMKQRVGIARALAMSPKVLLLDEPFGALDALTRAYLQDELMRIVAETNSTVIMVTHDVDEAVLLSDRIVMMTNGPSARIGEVLDVPLVRPRKRLELSTNATYLKCRQRVLEFLYERHRFVEAA